MNTNTKNRNELLELAKYAFHKPVTGGDEAFFALLEFAKAYQHMEENQLTSMVIDIPFDVFWKNEKLKMSGIGYVASYPEFRGNGAIRNLMTKLLQDEYKKGTALSYLAPFSYTFYEKFGYAYSFDRKVYELPAENFPCGRKTNGKIRRVTLAEGLEQLELIHSQAENEGSMSRAPHVWEYYFHYKSKPNFAIYEENGRPMGYLIYEFKGSTFVIRELISLSKNAKDAIYRFIASHASGFDKMSWVTTPRERFEYDVQEPAALTITQEPYMMARIINLDEFIKVNGEPDFAVEIIDEQIPENNRIFGSGQPVKMTIGAFTAEILRKNGAILREYF